MPGSVPTFRDARVPSAFWDKCKVDETTGCWNWIRAKTAGYGVYHDGVRLWRAHRVTYERLVGPIPLGLQADHLCRNRACCNPRHIEPVTQAENIRRGEAGINNSSKTHCAKGHAYTPGNTYLIRGKWRDCKTCINARSRVRKQKLRDQRNTSGLVG